jgi:hypothetical protein
MTTVEGCANDNKVQCLLKTTDKLGRPTLCIVSASLDTEPPLHSHSNLKGCFIIVGNKKEKEKKKDIL